MKKTFSIPTLNKSTVGLLIMALVIGGISAQAADVLNSPTGGYLLCINSTTKAVTYPAKTKCPRGYKKLILGAQGLQGATGLIGVTGPQGPGGGGSVGPAGAPGSNATLTCAQGGTCAIGDTGPGGGKVFYVQTATATAPWRYMEAAPNTWSGGVGDPTMKWCSVVDNEVATLNTGEQTSVQTSQAIGSGFRNTKMMLGTCTFGAANMTAAYNGGGKSNWFLPSKDELNQLYLAEGSVGGFADGYYWSSSEDGVAVANYTDFDGGFQGWLGKLNTTYVRPVRAF
jgi:hypothetical protein